jgi:prophage DNA circulation protein
MTDYEVDVLSAIRLLQGRVEGVSMIASGDCNDVSNLVKFLNIVGEELDKIAEMVKGL